jgi:hypothetical protein
VCADAQRISFYSTDGSEGRFLVGFDQQEKLRVALQKQEKTTCASNRTAKQNKKRERACKKYFCNKSREGMGDRGQGTSFSSI